MERASFFVSSVGDLKSGNNVFARSGERLLRRKPSGKKIQVGAPIQVEKNGFGISRRFPEVD